jgi:hypothetical protein
MENNQTKKFHFQEINKILQFPLQGNKGKYLAYKIQIKTPQTQNQPTPDVSPCQFIESTEVEENYPHTVGYYKQSTGEGANFQPQYLELRKIGCIEEFWLFLNASNL